MSILASNCMRSWHLLTKLAYSSLFGAQLKIYEESIVSWEGWKEEVSSQVAAFSLSYPPSPLKRKRGSHSHATLHAYTLLGQGLEKVRRFPIYAFSPFFLEGKWESGGG